MKVIGYTSFDSAYPTIRLLDPESGEEATNALIDEFKEHHIFYSGLTHQNNPLGVPVFDNGTCARCSLRMWSELMAMALGVVKDPEKRFSFALKAENEKLGTVDASKVVAPKKVESGRPFFKNKDVEEMETKLEIDEAKQKGESCDLTLSPLFEQDKAIALLYKDFYLQETMHREVVGWTDYESDYPNVGGSDRVLEDCYRAIGEEVRKHHYIICGDNHQGYKYGVPVFQDGTCYRGSQRAWGRVMAMAYDEKNDDGTYDYMDFYMAMLRDDIHLPGKEAAVKIPPKGATPKKKKATKPSIKKIKVGDATFVTLDKAFK